MVQNDKKDTVKLVVKKLQTQPKKHQKSLDFVDAVS